MAARIIRNVLVTRHGGVIGHDDQETDEDVEKAFRVVVKKLGRDKVAAMLAALDDGPGDEDEDTDEDDESEEIEAANALPSMSLLLAPPDKKPAARRAVVNADSADEPTALGLTPSFLLANQGETK